MPTCSEIFFHDQRRRVRRVSARMYGIAKAHGKSTDFREATKDYLDSVKRVRFAFESELDGRHLSPADHPKRLLDTMQLYRGWSLAAQNELQYKRRRNEVDGAAEFAEKMSDRARSYAATWIRDLFPHDELAGSARFGHSRFQEKLPAKVRYRVFKIGHDGMVDRTDFGAAETEGGNAVAAREPELPDDWFKDQRRKFELADTLAETSDRMLSMEMEAKLCRQRRLGWDEWEEKRQ